MSTYKFINKIKFRLSYSALVNNYENCNCATSVISRGIKILSVPQRYLRGAARIYEPLSGKIETAVKDDNVVDKQELTAEHKQPNVRKREIKDLLDNAASDPRRGVEEPADVWSEKPYPKEFYKKTTEVPRNDPKETSVLLFPGQGSQYIGMGKRVLRYPNVERMYSVASEIVGYDLLNLCLHGPKEDLDKTIYCQPAVVVTSLAAVEKLKDESPHIVDSCVATAGFSVGEITALIFAGVLSFTDGIKLTRIRAEAMQSASEMEGGGMMTVFYGADSRLGFGCSAAIEWCKRKGLEDPQCIIANYLFPGCRVIAGNNEALQFLKLNAKDFGIRRYKELPVSGAFHTKLMLPAVESMKIALQSIKLNNPIISVHSNISGKRYRDADDIKHLLPKQICSPVKWEQTMQTLYGRSTDLGFPNTYECGPGKSLSAILEKVNGKAWDCMQSVET